MLVFWTAAKDDTFLKVVVPVLEKIGDGIKYRKVTYSAEKSQAYMPKDGEVVLAMGAGPLSALHAAGHISKKIKIEKSRGQVFPCMVPMDAEFPDQKVANGGCWMTSYDPGIINIDITKDPLLRWDIRLMERFHRTRNLAPEIGEYEWVSDFRELIQYIKDKFKALGKRVDVACDTETEGLDPFNPDKKIVTVQFTVEEGQAQVCHVLRASDKRLALVKEQVNWILNSEMVSLKGANFKFDLLWFRIKWGLTSASFRMDTLLCGSLLNENRSNSLKGHACEYTTLGGYETEFESKYDKSKMGEVPKDDPSFLTYTGGDTDACYRVSTVMRKELSSHRNLQHFYTKILHPVSRVFEEIEYHGVEIDLKQFKRVRRKVQTDVDECKARLMEMLPRRLKLKYSEKYGDDMLVPKVLREFLFTKAGLNLKPQMTTPKTGEPTISYDHLMMFRGNEDAKEFIEVYKQMNGSLKTVSTFIDGFLKHLRSDNKLHPTFALFNGDLFGAGNSKDDAGTDSGRFSTRDPAIHILPKHTRWAKDLRSCYVCPPGHVMFQVDFNEGELRVAADLSGDPTMIESYRKGISLHAKTASALSLMPLPEYMALKETDKQKYDGLRRHAKSCNFGYIYGLQAEGFREYARTSFDLELTLEEATQNRETFFDTYPELPVWHMRYINTAHRNRQVVSPLGRVRHLPLITSTNWSVKAKQERRAINAPVQSCLSDICAWGITKIRQRFSFDEVRLAGMTHDAIWGYIPEKHALERIKEIKYIIESLPFEQDFGWKPKVQFLVDADISTTNMAEYKDVVFTDEKQQPTRKVAKK